MASLRGWSALLAGLLAGSLLTGCSQAPLPTGSATIPTGAQSTPIVTESALSPRPTVSRRPAPSRSPVRPSATRSARPTAPAGQALPVPGTTGTAGQLLTVTAPTWGATQASLQAWDRTGSGWQRHGAAVPAWLGEAGMSRQASEDSTGTPAGSFTLTQAFGNYADPGTALPYFQAGPDDWWSGDSSSPTYNSHQRCAAASCPFRTGLSENLYDAGAVYGYAVVIDYNTAPAIPGRGSAFFLHVTQNQPTAGCVSIDQDALVQILRWLSPARHPRIIMGVG